LFSPLLQLGKIGVESLQTRLQLAFRLLHAGFAITLQIVGFGFRPMTVFATLRSGRAGSHQIGSRLNASSASTLIP
jgi:hypothetical protein